MSLLEIFSSIPDPRIERTKLYSVPQILILSVLSYLCGHTGYRGIKRFGDAHSGLLYDMLGLARVPSHVTLRAVLQRIDKNALTAAFHQWTASFSPPRSTWLGGDGKTLCSTVENAHNKNQDFEAVVSLFAHDSGLVQVIGDYKNKSKGTGEQHIIRFLMGQLKDMGAVITLDALHTQKKQ